MKPEGRQSKEPEKGRRTEQEVTNLRTVLSSRMISIKKYSLD